jgi:predicted transposase YbfD/YdcC
MRATRCRSADCRGMYPARSPSSHSTASLWRSSHPTMAHDTVETFFGEARREDWSGISHQYLSTEDAGHGRLERREHWTIADPNLLAYLRQDGDWPGLASVGMVERTRTTPEKVTREVNYFLSSLKGEVTTFAARVRGHWGLDVAFREDDSRVRIGHAAETFGVLRRVALNRLRQDTATKAGVKARRLNSYDAIALRSPFGWILRQAQASFCRGLASHWTAHHHSRISPGRSGHCRALRFCHFAHHFLSE